MKKSKKRQVISGLLFRAANLWQQKCDGTNNELTLRQSMLLDRIKTMPEQSANLSRLSEVFGGSRQNVRQLVTALADKGYVTRTQSEKDQREIRISLTDKARAHFEDNDKAMDDLLREVFSGIGEKSLDGTISCLSIMIENLEDMDDDKKKARKSEDEEEEKSENEEKSE